MPTHQKRASRVSVEVRDSSTSRRAVVESRTLRRLARIRALVLPPAWTNVWLSTDPRAHLQATVPHLMNRIRRFLNRAELDTNEMNILRGLLTAVQNRRRMAGGPR